MIKRAVTLGLVIIFVMGYLLPRVNWGKIQYVPAETVTVTGEAKTQVKNQTAVFVAGVDTVGAGKEATIKEASEKVAGVIKAAKDFGIGEENIKTQNINVYQEEEMFNQGGVQRSRKGQWRVSNSVEIRLNDINRAAELADLLTSGGANNVYGPNFQIDDTSGTDGELMEMAIKNAREKAVMAAQSSGRKLGKMLNVVEGGAGNAGPMPYKDIGGGGGVPVEGGSGMVTKTVTVSFELK